ncbi:amidohydrolase family protein [Dokdonella sp.]|uniref:amidohydrolase family protein n=1 Tax=Dokdonella sp. TaxID=2291710 RepID=UPI003C702785
MKKWLIRITLAVVVLSLLSLLFIDRELSKMYGGHARVAEINLPERDVERYAIVNVNVLSPSADHFTRDQTVVIDGGEIESVGMKDELADGIETIDGGGMFLVPGYIDSHVHTWESENDLLLYVANGVTQIREMNGSEESLRWKHEIVDGRIGPDMFVVAPQMATFDLIEGWFVGWTQHKTIVRTDSQVEQAVRAFKAKGYDAVKASSFLSRESYSALSRETVEQSIPLVGHIPLDADLEAVWQSNQSEVAHVEELMKALRDEFGRFSSETAEEFLDFVRSRSDDVADHLLDKGISVTSTLALIDSLHRQKSDLQGVLDEAQIQYANPGIAGGSVITSHGIGWLPDVNIYRFPADWDEVRRQKSLIYWKAYSKAQHIVFSALLEKGVPILAGSDANTPVTVPGFSLHEEMEALNEEGMTTAQALASATSVPAAWLKTNTGEIRPGFKANLVLLAGNPLENIDATDSIEMVIKDGRVFSRSDLDGMLSAVKSANDASR